jgi:hypothetical protein
MLLLGGEHKVGSWYEEVRPCQLTYVPPASGPTYVETRQLRDFG